MFIAVLTAISLFVLILFGVRRIVKEKTDEQERADKQTDKTES